jgi:hypothetical protein
LQSDKREKRKAKPVVDLQGESDVPLGVGGVVTVVTWTGSVEAEGHSRRSVCSRKHVKRKELPGCAHSYRDVWMYAKRSSGRSWNDYLGEILGGFVCPCKSILTLLYW